MKIEILYDYDRGMNYITVDGETVFECASEEDMANITLSDLAAMYQEL